jgi:hypothetical protein
MSRNAAQPVVAADSLRSPLNSISLAKFKIESLVHDHKYHGATTDEHRGDNKKKECS